MIAYLQRAVSAFVQSDFWVYCTLVLIMSVVVFGVRFAQPDGLFWDENYHIAAAQKYRQDTFFLEPHPPLGKLIIAGSEHLFGLNNHLDTSEFITTDKIDEVPQGYSFTAVRLPGVVAAIGSVLVLFLLVFKITRSGFMAFSTSSFLLFNNAFVVHSRAAMLESMQIFSILSFLLVWLIALQKKTAGVPLWILLGFLFGIALSIKVNSAILLGFVCILAIWELFGGIHNSDIQDVANNADSLVQAGHAASKTLALKGKVNTVSADISKTFQIILKWSISLCVALLVFVTVQGVHGMLAGVPYQGRFYSTSQEFRTELTEAQWVDFPQVAWQTTVQWYQYQDQYQQGVPAFDPNKEGENGGLPWMWIFGGRAIAYRWGSYFQHQSTGEIISGNQLPDQANASEFQSKSHYLYLVAHPVIWILVFVSSVIGAGLLAWLVFRQRVGFFADSKNMVLTGSVGGYWAYLLAVSYISRVMYLYHYFVPLVFGTITWCMLLVYLRSYRPVLARWLAYGALLSITIVFVWFAPLTYFIPMTEFEFTLRNWLPLWNMDWKGG